jgi:hypothetical protein
LAISDLHTAARGTRWINARPMVESERGNDNPGLIEAPGPFRYASLTQQVVWVLLIVLRTVAP